MDDNYCTLINTDSQEGGGKQMFTMLKDRKPLIFRVLRKVFVVVQWLQSKFGTRRVNISLKFVKNVSFLHFAMDAREFLISLRGYQC